MRIRKATNRDKSQWVALGAQLWPEAKLNELKNEVGKMLKDVNWGVFVAEHEGKIVGFIECSIRVQS